MAPNTISWGWWRQVNTPNWIKATKPVFFDFGENVLWRLVLYNPTSRKGVIGPIKRDSLVEDIAQDSILDEWPISDILQNSVADAPHLSNRKNDDAQLLLF
jgi:hypothetical protein